MDLLTEHLTLAEDPLHTIRVVVADGHQLVREGVKRVVAVDPGIVVVGESADLAATRPDVLLLDLSLSGTHELDALRAVTERFAGMPVLVLSSHSEAQFGIAVLRLGAAGYLCKSLAADVIVKAIRKAHAGGRYLSETLAELLAEKLASPHPRHPHELLTEREHDVLRLLALGSPVKQVAGKLDISISSVNTYRGRIFTKLRIKSNAELIRYAMRHRLVS
ncbi:response regulator transcription factor [Herbaspirillum sp. RV1423]|uniref:LuxR C-terminal-related transcriptional regulator n=1 Tax=Herbaspirillum sp. RV1423 TaxID=1443993 RepID=UPI0004B3476B|nr:response regulator transcription factor [Herbaspirillum sp. RV1423]